MCKGTMETGTALKHKQAFKQGHTITDQIIPKPGRGTLVANTEAQ